MSVEPYVRACVMAQLDWERSASGRLPEGEGKRIVKEAHRLVAKIKADALREAAAEFRHCEDYPYRATRMRATEDYLNDRANQIEEEA